MEKPIEVSREFRLVWTKLEATLAVRADRFLITGPRNGRFRVHFGQVMEPVFLDAEDAEALEKRGTINIEPIACLEFDEAAMRELWGLMNTHFHRIGFDPAGPQKGSEVTE